MSAWCRLRRCLSRACDGDRRDRRFGRLVLPDAKDRPAGLLKSSPVARVALGVAPELRTPNSAKELAKAWAPEDGTGAAETVTALLRDALGDPTLTLTTGLPEHRTRFDANPRGPRVHDLSSTPRRRPDRSSSAWRVRATRGSDCR